MNLIVKCYQKKLYSSEMY